MSGRPAAAQRIGRGFVPGEPKEPVYGHSCRCGYPAAHWHHIVSRAKLGGPYSVVEIDGLNWGNLVPLCFSCHEAVEHRGNSDLWAEIFLPTKDEDLPYIFHWVQGRKGPEPLRGIPRAASAAGDSSERAGRRLPEQGPPLQPAQQSEGVQANSGQESQSEPLQAASSVNPGEKCPTCNRRVNHKRTDKSPVSTTISARLPADEKESMNEMIHAMSQLIGADELKYPAAKTIEVGMLLIHHHPEDAQEIVDEMKAA